MDQPYPTFEIALKNEKEQKAYNTNKQMFNYTFYVDIKTYNKLHKYMNNYKFENQNINSSYFPEGTYFIECESNIMKVAFGRKKSKKLFKDIGKLVESQNIYLDEILSDLISRL
ncbi:hypothetical protein [Flavobacterium beibuense]|nr:hypothetical protein [Flavobacterium beibuense]